MAHAGPFGYVVNSDSTDPAIPDSHIDNLYRIDLATGTAERLGPTGFLDIEGLAFGLDDTLYAVDDESKTLLRLSTETGQGTPVSGTQNNLGIPLQMPFDFGMTVGCSGAVLISSDNQAVLLEADIEQDGSAEEIGGTQQAPLTALASRGETLLGLGDGSSPNLYSVDSADGSVEMIGALSNAATYTDAGMDYDSTGQLWAVTDRGEQSAPSQILRIDGETGEATPVAETISGVESLAIGPPGDCQPAGPGPNPEDVPTLSKLNLAAMALVLLLAGGLLARARAQR